MVRDSCLWDSGRWEGWGIIMGWIPVEFWHHLVSQNLKTWIFLLFSQYWGGVQKKSMISPLLIYNKFRYHTHKIRLEKLVPLNYRFPTDNKKSSNENRPNRFQTRLLAEIWVSKNPGLVSGSPPGGLYFQKWPPTKYIFLEMPENIKNLHCLTKWLPFLCLFILFFSSPHPPIPIPTPA